MLTARKKYLINRNKSILEHVNNLFKNGTSLGKAIKSASEVEDFKVTQAVASKIIHQKYYPWSPFFEYNDNGNIVYKRDWDGNMVAGSETEYYADYIKTLPVTTKSKVA